MEFIADLHIHSRFSMATSRQLNVAHLAMWGKRKGIQVLGTGDFTHPAWRGELRRDLVYDEESGLYRVANMDGPYFCLQTEISSIYKRGGKTRKVHNLVYVPTLDAADRLSKKLAVIGNIESDGRPILGLDSRDLLELVLECSPDAHLVPAHIWTPWFSLFGSKSGFDRIEDCYGDLTSHIFALETGLSSDPPMNRCLSALDGFALVSNSDAHSGANLGREANVFSGKPSYQGMFSALRNAARRVADLDEECRFLGTMEFYPEEGKYHLDGHRNCGVSLTPKESRELNNICPACGKPLTIGVLHRVMELADREEPATPPHEPEARMLVPLASILAEILNTGGASRKVADRYEKAIKELGPELAILCQIPEGQIRAFWEPLGEAVARMRGGNVLLEGGYDGEFGKVRFFTPEEKADLARMGHGTLFVARISGKPRSQPVRHLTPIGALATGQTDASLSYSQRQAAQCPSPALILAGPGSGKTRVLIERVLNLIQDDKVQPEHILVLTFTRKAASELRERLKTRAVPQMPLCDTLHGLARALLGESGACPDAMLLPDEAARSLFLKASPGRDRRKMRELWRDYGLCRERNMVLPADMADPVAHYRKIKGDVYLDFGDLIEWLAVNATAFSGRWQHVLVDEVQDLSPVQLKIIRQLLPPDGSGFFGIGDPDQSIYEFRGADGQILEHLKNMWPDIHIASLADSFRSPEQILKMGYAVTPPISGRLSSKSPILPKISLYSAEDERDEAAWITEVIRKLLGPTSHTIADQREDQAYAPEDIAILTRLKAQFGPLASALRAGGIPFITASTEGDKETELISEFLLQARLLGENPETVLRCLQKTDDAKWNIFGECGGFRHVKTLWRQCQSWEKAIEEEAWARERGELEGRARHVRLMTMHAAKGLEFRTVFLPGLENGIMPLRRSLLSANMEETDEKAEARLLYVGITRSSDGLYLSHCRQRQLFGKRLELAPSPFLGALAPFCLRARRRTKRSMEKLTLC